MNNKKLATSALGVAGLEVCRLENEKYKRFESTDVEVPEKIDLKIKKLIAAHNRKVQLKDTLIKIACIALAFLIISSAVLAVNVEARDRLKKLIRQVFNTNIDYIPIKNEIEKTSEYVIKDVVVGWIPEGFELKNELQNGHISSFYYEQEDESINVRCSILSDGMYAGFSSLVNEKVIKSEIGEYNNLYYEFLYADEFSKTNNLIILNEVNEYIITIDSTLNKEEMFMVFDKLEVTLEKRNN